MNHFASLNEITQWWGVFLVMVLLLLGNIKSKGSDNLNAIIEQATFIFQSNQKSLKIWYSRDHVSLERILSYVNTRLSTCIGDSAIYKY